MSAKSRIAVPLSSLVGSALPVTHTVAIPGTAPVAVALEVTAVDALSCALREVRLDAPHLATAGFDVLRDWAARLCGRITYLLENIGALEFDESAGTVLIRSTPPDRQTAGNQYYEILLQSSGNGQFALRRFRTEKGRTDRDQVDMHLTHQVVEKLVNDLADTLPQ
jgi:hypothetical protein